jgi:very-short-patch-repair endonuclease
MKPRHCLQEYAIELRNEQYDMQRDNCLRANGFSVLRFWNNDVIETVEGVLQVIRLECLK